MNRKNRKKLLSKISQKSEVEKIAQELSEQISTEPVKPIDPIMADKIAHEMFVKIVDSINYDELLDSIVKELN